MRIVSLASGSKGNCYYVETNEIGVLIDCGLSLKMTEERLSSIGVDASKVKYILISHEHSDHVKGLEKFWNKYHPTIYSNYLSADKLMKLFPRLDKNIITFNNETFNLGDIIVTPIEVSHDSVNCTAYRLDKNDASACVLTDLGYANVEIIEKVAGCKVIYLESNHDEVMLRNCKYPSIIKSRIASNNGHLSNKQAGEVMAELINRGTTHFVLSHISENSNTYEKAYITIAEILAKYGIDAGKDVVIRFAHQYKVGNNFLLSEGGTNG